MSKLYRVYQGLTKAKSNSSAACSPIQTSVHSPWNWSHPFLYHLKLYAKRNSKFFKGGVNYLFNSVDRIAFWCNGNTKVVVVISVFEEASILFIFSRFLGIGHSEKVILTHKPITKATVLNNWKKSWFVKI